MKFFKGVLFNCIALMIFFAQGYSQDHSVVFVHLGENIPSWTFTSLKQARYMNETCDIFLLANSKSIQGIDLKVREDLDLNSILLIDTDAIPITQEHLDFRNQNGLSDVLNGFWKYTTERFFVIFDFLEHMQIQHVVHLENDTMLYVDLNEILPQFERLNISIAAPFQSTYCCVPCFVYIKDISGLKKMIEHIALETKKDSDCDMLTLASFFRKFGDDNMFTLPILMGDYAQYYTKRVSSFPPDNDTSLEFLAKNEWAFPGYIFDAAAFGVYVNGNDKRFNKDTGIGQIHHRTLCDPSHFSYHWGTDAKGRVCPYLTFKQQKYRIVNLHFHSKELAGYTSYRDSRAKLPIGSAIEKAIARQWLTDEYFPRISGKMLYVGVGAYTQNYHLLTRSPELFQTIDVDEEKRQFGSPFGHYVLDFMKLKAKGEYDHCCLFGMLGLPPKTQTSIYTICDEDSIQKSFWHAHKMIKVGGTLQFGPNYKDVSGQDLEFWEQKFKTPPLDRYEIIYSTKGCDNIIWWGKKLRE